MPVEEKIKVFDAEDKTLKILGELLSNDTSRKIIKCLIEKQMYTNEISTKLDIRVSLVIHHLKKLEDIGVLEIEHKQIVRKGNKHRFFRMVPNLFVAPNETKESLDKKGTLKNFFKESVKFSAILISFFIGTRFPITSTEITEPKSENKGMFAGDIIKITVEENSIFNEVLPIIGIVSLIIFFSCFLLKKRKKD